MNYLKLREEPLKTAVFKDFFSDYDYTQIGNIDFVISASPRHYREGKDALRQGERSVNHWIPFTEQEIGCKKAFKSHFMSDFIRDFLSGKYPKNEEKQGIWALLEEKDEKPVGEPPALRQFSEEAKAVFDAGRELWKYYHSQKNANPDASFYDIRKYFQGETNGRMNASSEDEKYTALIADLRAKMKVLAAKIAEKVYKYGFLK